MGTTAPKYLTLAAWLPLVSAAASMPAAAIDQPQADQRAEHNWQFHHEHVLGTSLEVTVRARSEAQARQAEDAVLQAIDRHGAILSTWNAESEASRWARTQYVAVPVSHELMAVLGQFDFWRDRTSGALDASVAVATELWQRATAENRTPSAQELALAREAMQQAHWSLDAEQGTATRLSAVPLAFATFTKSYITSRAADAALAAGATGVTINLGGDVVVRGNLTQLVAITDPQAASVNEAPLEHVLVRDGAVATSGSYHRGFQFANAARTQMPAFSHILDPRTAEPCSHVLSSTVVAQDAVTANALATAFSVLPMEDSRALAAATPGVQYLLVLANGEQVRSSGQPPLPSLHMAAFLPKGASHATAGMWNPAFELSLTLDLPRIEDARYRRPYVAVWIEDADHFPVRTLALWTQNPRWLPDLKQWYRDDQIRTLAEGSDISKTVSSATRPPGRYTLKWDGKDNEGKPVKAGKYTVLIEASREHGGYDIQRHEVDIANQAQQVTLPAEKELGATAVDYHKR